MMVGAEIKVWNHKGESPPCLKCQVKRTCYNSRTRRYKKTGNKTTTIRIGKLCDDFNQWIVNNAQYESDRLSFKVIKDD
jgi:hypothetical protein